MQNRVIEIRGLIPSEFWFHCSSEQNIADTASRGTMATNLLKNDEWWNGPDWVRNCNPRQTELSKPTNEVLLEANASKIREVQSTRVHVSAIDEAVGNISKVIACDDYSRVSRLYSVTAYVLRFIENLKRNFVS